MEGIMKALCLKEPYAGLVACGEKTIETRVWWPPNWIWRKEFLITVAKNPKTKNSGLAICTAKISGCVRMTESHVLDACCEVYPGAFAWLLYDVKRIKPFPVKGMLKFFDVDLDAMGIKLEYIK
jgi:hypothetical protein